MATFNELYEGTTNSVTDIRLDGSRGYLYEMEFLGDPVGRSGLTASDIPSTGTSATTATVNAGVWLRVAERGTLSGLPVDVGRVFRTVQAQTLAAGDMVQGFSLHRLCFATDISFSATNEKIDATTQCDVDKTYIISNQSDKTGSVNGYMFDGSPAQLRLLSCFSTVVVFDGNGYTQVPKNSSRVIYCMLSRKESEESARGFEIWDFLPMTIDQITTDKPMSGMQPFNFNFSVAGSESPHVYLHKIGGVTTTTSSTTGTTGSSTSGTGASSTGTTS